MTRWLDIPSFPNMLRSLQHAEVPLSDIMYKAKVKLHGTNAGVRIERGKLVSHTGPIEFEAMLAMIRSEEEGVVWVREIGFGLNRGLGFEKRITEPTGFERFAGMHFSLGLKHDMYRKKMSRKIFQKYHVDIFCLVSRVTIGDVVVFEKGGYVG